MYQKKTELLAPAKNIDTGIAAINFGADAVYIGPEKFSARRAAGNSISDIEKLAAYAHRYNARVYAALNTILFDNELDETQQMIEALYQAGTDALIIQDMGILEMDLPPIPLHASTQADNSDLERIKFLDRAGFKRIVLARELSLERIAELREQVSCELECFVHGALCVSFSGRCYMSAASGGRSANRGECAQPCRKKWDMLDAGGSIIKSGHLLSTMDLNRTESIPRLIDAGVDSFKIEGRLKDIHYVKNITAHYRLAIDRALEERNGISRSSSGSVIYDFTPDPEKTFNRGYTEYFLHGRTGPVSSGNTPKFTGKKTARVKTVHSRHFTAEFYETLHNGDGLSFSDSEGNISGIRVNRVEGEKVYPHEMNGICPGTVLYRNLDSVFEKALDSSGTLRRISIDMELSVNDNTVSLTITDEKGISVSGRISAVEGFQPSTSDTEQHMLRHLKKLGATIFAPRSIKLHGTRGVFIPPSILNELRRNTIELLEMEREQSYTPPLRITEKTSHPFPTEEIDFSFNVSNSLARKFYERHGVKKIRQAFECIPVSSDFPVMKTKLCLKYENGSCPVLHGKDTFGMPLFLSDGRKRYRLTFDCSECVMYIWNMV